MSARSASAVAAVIVLATGLAGCGSASHPAHHVANTPAAVATHSQSCASQVHTWAHDQGAAQLNQLSRDTTALSKAGGKAVAAMTGGSDAAGQMARWQADSTALETDAQAAASSPPPACAGAAGYGIAMQDYTTSARDFISAASDFSSGSYTAAITLITAGTSAMGRANRAIARVSAAISG